MVIVVTTTTPLHTKVGDVLRRRITSGELPVGAALPSEAQLCEEFGASRGTVRQALAALRSEGLIGGGRGRPPVVRERAARQPFSTFLSFSQWAALMGCRPGQRTLEVARRSASPAAQDALALDDGAHVIDVLRLRLLDGEPAMIERTSFVESVGRLLFDFDPDSGSIYAYLIGRGADLYAGRHTIDATAADATDSDLLGVPAGSPLLRERRRVTSRDGVALEYSEDRYRPDIVTFTVENTHEATPGILRGLSRDGADLVSPDIWRTA